MEALLAAISSHHFQIQTQYCIKKTQYALQVRENWTPAVEHITVTYSVQYTRVHKVLGLIFFSIWEIVKASSGAKA